ncbi:head GIN domain-containing protein [Flaviaesturariibacter terrae]
MRTLILAAALGLAAPAVFAQDNDKTESISGNGKIVTANVPVQPFESLEASGVYELKLSQGDKESVKIEADENLQALFHVRNEGSKLVIDMGKKTNFSLKKSTKLVVYVTFRTLKSLSLNMVGNVRSEESLSFTDVTIKNNSVGNVSLKLTANSIHLNNNAVGNVTLSGRAQNAVFNNDAVGSIRAGDFVVQTVNINNDGVGSAEVNAEKELKVKDSFLGKVRNKGAAKVQKKEVI